MNPPNRPNESTAPTVHRNSRGAASSTTVHPVLLVGAGPGDPELLTLKAARAIAAADVILVDALVNPEILSHARADARITAVGKRGGCASTPQAFIEKLMIREALAGHRVVRLKGGDPLIFGRAGEEIAALRAAGLPWQVINGITSALAAGAGLGVSLTHRDHSPGIAFVTGHPKTGHDLDPAVLAAWQAMLRAGITLAIYMGTTRLEEWRAPLLAAGIDPAMPAARIIGAGRTDMQITVTTLANLDGGTLDAQTRAGGPSSAGDRQRGPVMLLLGEVAAQAEESHLHPLLERARSVAQA